MVTNSRAHTMQASQTAHGNPWLLLSSVIFSSQLQMAIKPSQFHRSYNYCDCRDYNNQSNYNIFSFEYNRYKHCEYHRHISGRSSRDSFNFLQPFSLIFATTAIMLYEHYSYNYHIIYYNNHFKDYEHCEH